MNHPHLTGLIAAPHTPFAADGSLNLAAIETQAEQLAANGVAAAFVCGTTGEGSSLTTAERMDVARRWCEAAGATLPVLVNVGHNCLGSSRELAAHAAASGAAAIASMGPTFLRPAGLDDLVAWCAETAAAAPRLPFYYYHIPSLTGLDFAMAEFLAAAEDHVPTLAGLKYTHTDLLDFGRCLTHSGGRFNVLFGRDEMLLAALALGGRGAVGSTYNFAAPLYHRVIQDFEAGDLAAARAAQAQSREMVAVLLDSAAMIVTAGKAVMRRVGIDCGPVRPPLRNMTADQIETMIQRLDRGGFDSYRSR